MKTIMKESELNASTYGSADQLEMTDHNDYLQIKSLLEKGVNLKKVYRQSWGWDIQKICLRKHDGAVCIFNNTRTQEYATKWHGGVAVIADHQGRSNVWDDSIKEWV